LLNTLTASFVVWPDIDLESVFQYRAKDPNVINFTETKAILRIL